MGMFRSLKDVEWCAPRRRGAFFGMVLGGLALGAGFAAHAASPINLKPSNGTITYGATTDQFVAGGANGCVLAVGELTLLDISSVGATAGAPGWTLRDRQIGVNGTSSGSPCSQVRVDQGIQIALGSAFADSALKIRSATLALTAHPRATVDIRTYAGATEVHRILGYYCNQNCSIVLNGSNDLDTASTEDKLWDRVQIVSRTGNRSSESGAFSLKDSSFVPAAFIPEGSLGCTGQDSDNGATLRRLFNAVGDNAVGSGCRLIPYRLDFDGQTVTFLADYTVLPEGVEPAFAFELPWRSEYVTVPYHAPQAYLADDNPPEAAGTFAQAVPLTTHQFAVGDTRWLLDACPGQPQYTAGLFTGLVFPGDFDASVDGDNDLSALPGFQYGCLIERNIEVVSDSALCPTAPDVTGAEAICVKVTETGYLRGDWTATRQLR